MNQEEINARVELRALIDEYAFHADSRNYDAWAQTFTPDGTVSCFNPGEDTPFVGATGHADIAAMLHGNDAYARTFHLMANHHITIDGDTGSGYTYGQAHHVLADDPDTEAYVWLIRYADQYAKTDAGWKFSSREIRIQFIQYVDTDVSAYPFRSGASTIAS